MVRIEKSIKTLILEILDGNGPSHIREVHLQVVEFRPDHDVTVGMTFRALTLEPELLRGLLEASEYLDEEIVRRARSREPMVLFEDDDN